MLYEFKCRATGPVVMMQPVAERLLAIIGKAPGPTGIVLPEQMPAAIAALRAAIAQESAQVAQAAREAEAARDDDTQDDEPAGPAPVTLAQRAWPLIDMLQAAHAAGREISWGV
jgi:hypothetical protein